MHVFCLCNFRGLFPFSDFSLDRQANQGGAELYIFWVVFVNGRKSIPFYRLVLLRFLNILRLKYVSALVNCWRRVPRYGAR
jgi:hypothetical protein